MNSSIKIAIVLVGGPGSGKSSGKEQTIKILANKDIGPLDWIEFRDLKSGSDAFKQIHDGTCVSPKIILLP